MASARRPAAAGVRPPALAGRRSPTSSAPAARPPAASRRVQPGAGSRSTSTCTGWPACRSTWEARLLAPILAHRRRRRRLPLRRRRAPRHPGLRPRACPRSRSRAAASTAATGVRVHTSTDLDRCQRSIVDGIPATDLDRTILDLGRTVGDRRLLRAIEWARARTSARLVDLIRTLAAPRSTRAAGHPPAATGDPREHAIATRSPTATSSSSCSALLRSTGFPTPVLHHRVFDGDRFVAEVDLAYPQLKIAIELDGAVHLEREVRERDLPRQNDLVLARLDRPALQLARFASTPGARRRARSGPRIAARSSTPSSLTGPRSVCRFGDRQTDTGCGVWIARREPVRWRFVVTETWSTQVAGWRVGVRGG